MKSREIKRTHPDSIQPFAVQIYVKPAALRRPGRADVLAGRAGAGPLMHSPKATQLNDRFFFRGLLGVLAILFCFLLASSNNAQAQTQCPELGIVKYL